MIKNNVEVVPEYKIIA